jgi:D-xylose 1-dehydrogenase (NADP+, D-xylono-1,5-lactone-forming)
LKLRWGILSTASINAVILRSCKDSAACEFVAVASRDAGRARRYALANGISQAYGSYQDLLADRNVDAVYVSLPNGLHMQWCIAALNAGKHVFCEKPLTRHAHEIIAAYAAAERAGRVFAEAFMYRHHPQTDLICEIVRSGRLGRLALLSSSHSFPMPSSEYGQRLPAALDAGSLMDLGCYQIGVSRLLAGEPESVYGEQVLHDSGVDMRFAGTLRFPDGVLAQFDCAMDVPLRNCLTVIGSQATLLVSDPWHCRGGPMYIYRDERTEKITPPTGDPYRLEFEAFARAVAGERIPAFARDEAVMQARLLEAFYKSASLGRRITLPAE